MVEQIRDVASMVEANPGLKQRMQDDPVETLKTIGAMPLQTDPWIYRGVVLALGAATILSVVLSAGLAFYDKTTPEGLLTLGAGSATALALLLRGGSGAR